MIDASMTGRDWPRVKDVLSAVLEARPESRSTVLDNACAGDQALREEVEALLRADAAAGTFIEQPAFVELGIVENAEEPQESNIGRSLGPYRIEQRIGHGGMGTVYLARRADNEFERRVAIKMIRRGMDSELVIRRFRHERQILASLDHPHIAALFDGGTTDDGLPYFVMEYIEGKPLLEYCDEKKLSIAERLKLFRRICSAVAFAHQNLVVHRDLKPSNILVQSDGTPKLLDFGIAKMLNAEIGGQSPDPTATANRLMTPDYASPEQVRGEQITTTSDVYSLGVLLYELLTGHRPYQIKKHTPVEIIQAVCESEPPLPSVAITKELTPTTQENPREMQNPPSVIRNPRSLRGDIDNIVLMSLRKEPSRRYSSVEQFSEDARRHLEGLPVTARPLTLFYRAGKFAKRHRIPVAFASFLVTLLIGFGVTEAIQSNRIARERDQAQIERERAQKVSDFLTEIFRSADPRTTKGDTLTARELLDRGAERVQNELNDQPEIQAKLMSTMAAAYFSLGVYERAEALAAPAAESQRQLFGNENEETLGTIQVLANAKYMRGDRTAEALYREIVETRRKLTGESPQLIQNLQELAVLLKTVYENDEAENTFLDGVEMARRVLPADDPRRQDILSQTATFLMEVRSNLTGAEKFCREALTVSYEIEKTDRYKALLGYSCMSRILKAQGRYAEAEPFLYHILEVRRAVYKEDNPEVSNTLHTLGELYLEKGEYNKSEEYLRQAVAIRRKFNSTLLVYSLYDLSCVKHKQGELAEAEKIVREAIALIDSRDRADRRFYPSLGHILTDKKDYRAAERYLREAADYNAENFGKTNLATSQSEILLGVCLTKERRFVEAEPLLENAYENLKKILSPDHPDLKFYRQKIVEWYQAQGLKMPEGY